jgi:hypothetical protein
MAPIDPQPISARRVMTPEVMVSYSSLDRPQVLQLVKRLRSAGVAAWIDQGGIDGAQRWGEEIVNAIDACKTVVGNALRVFGAGQTPDKLLAVTSVVFAVLRSIVFAAVFWSLLQLVSRPPKRS